MALNRIYLFLILLFAFFHAEAKLQKSKRYIDDYEPEKFHSDNKLLSDYTSHHDRGVQPIIIKGRVVDVDNQAVANAKVYAWQVGPDGKYPYKQLRTRVNKGLLNPNSRYRFKGSGIANTNNLGEFTFVTMYPVSKKMNYINMRVELNGTELVQTRMHITSRAPRVLYNPDLDYQDNEYYFKIVVPKVKPYF